VTTRTTTGLGLGLAIVRNLVEMHGGTVRVESPGEGQGATFIVEFPLLEESQSQVQSGVPPSTADPSLEGIKVLVVDDELDTRDFLATTLELSGATVSTAVSSI
jgi:hypothetical protein